MKKSIILFFFLINIPFSTAQNLIRNGGFEDYKGCDYNREVAVLDAAPWYIAGGTPDAYQFYCYNGIYDSPINTPYKGEVFIALGGAPFTGGGFYAEGLGIELTQTLEAGEYYLLELNTRSYRFNGSNASPRNQCPITPHQQLKVYLSQDSFKITHEYDDIFVVNSYTNGHLAFSDSSVQMIPLYAGLNTNFFTDEIVVPWKSQKVCIQANGGERFLGITLQTGQYEVAPTCQSTASFFPVHYINLDNIQLTAFPDEIRVTHPICIDEPNEIRLREFIPQVFIDATFRWSDGNSADVRNVFREGTEVIDVFLPCDTMQLFITLDGSDCKTYINVPTAFSPNNYDGINDEIFPFIKNYWEIIDYEYQVFNRWGQLLFQTTDYNTGWNGMVNGEMSGEGVYVWTVKYQQNEDGKIKSYVKSGDFTLMK